MADTLTQGSGSSQNPIKAADAYDDLFSRKKLNEIIDWLNSLIQTRVVNTTGTCKLTVVKGHPGILEVGSGNGPGNGNGGNGLPPDWDCPLG